MKYNDDAYVTRYDLRVRAISACVILALALVFYTFPKFAIGDTVEEEEFAQELETFDIPPTQQFEQPPPPARPSIPIASEDENLNEDITIEETGLDDFTWEAPPPPPEEGPEVAFIPYDQAPTPIGGAGALRRNLNYPDIARKAGLQGTVVIQAFINEEGRVTDWVVKQSHSPSLDNAAIEAVRITRWNPAKQRDREVGVWYTIPIEFQLNTIGER